MRNAELRAHVRSILERAGRQVTEERIDAIEEHMAEVAMLWGGASMDDSGEVFGPNDPRWGSWPQPPLPSIITGRVR